MSPFSRACWLGVGAAAMFGCASEPRVDAMAAGPMAPGTMKAMSGAAGMPADLDEAIKQAQVQRAAGDLAGAARTLSQLVLVAPDDARVVGEYGKTLVAQGRSDDALAFLERAIALKPDWTFYSALGIAYDQKGIFAAAQTAYDRALALKPGEPSVLSNNALSHMQSGDLEGAEKLLIQAAQNGQPSPKIASNLALLRSLKSAAREAPLPPVPAPAAAASANPVAVPNAIAPAQAAKPDPAPDVVPAKTSAVVPIPRIEKTELPSPAVAAVAEPPRVAAQSAVTSTGTVAVPGIESLKSDPAVRMQAVPHDPLAGPVRSSTRAAKATKAPGTPESVDGAAGLRPALSDWDWRLPTAPRW